MEQKSAKKIKCKFYAPILCIPFGFFDRSSWSRLIQRIGDIRGCTEVNNGTTFVDIVLILLDDAFVVYVFSESFASRVSGL